MEKLSKTEKVKRLREVKKGLKEGYAFMCCIYRTIYYPKDRLCKDLFKDIPELYKFKPRGTQGSDVWHYPKDGSIKRIKAIDKAIKLIQSK